MRHPAGVEVRVQPVRHGALHPAVHVPESERQDCADQVHHHDVRLLQIKNEKTTQNYTVVLQALKVKIEAKVYV